MPTELLPGLFAAYTPAGTAGPVVFDSPHSGFQFPSDFRTLAPVKAIRTSCDVFVDELFESAPRHGATLIASEFPRAYIDTNRDADDVDPQLIDGPWDRPVAASEYTRRGMGLVRRYALPGVPLYDRKLTVAEVHGRIERYYLPYRNAVKAAVDGAVRSWGRAWHVNCHSMKSRGNEMNVDKGSLRPDFVISDRNGLTANPDFTAWVAGRFSAMGYSVQINDPYQGGNLIRWIGRPDAGIDSVQIEVNRRLYIDESTYQKNDNFPLLSANIEAFVADLAAHAGSLLAARPTD